MHKLGILAALALVAFLPSGAPAQVATKDIGVIPRPQKDFTVSIDSDQYRYNIGENVRITFRASEDAYVYIYSTNSNGETRQVFPNFYDRDNRVEGGKKYRIPRGGDYRLVALPPSGSEVLTIYAVRSDRKRNFGSGSISADDPFPRARSPKIGIESIVPRRSPGVRLASDTRTIYIRGRGGDSDRGGDLRVSSNPSNASVYLNDSYSGQTPLNLDNVRPGEYRVTIWMPGYNPERTNVTIRGDRTTNISKQLQPTYYYPGW